MDWWSIIVALVAVFLIAVYQTMKLYNKFEGTGIPHDKGLPYLGSAWKAVFQLKSFAEVVKTIYNIHPDAKYIGFFEFATPIIVIRDIELLKNVTVKYFDHFTDHRSLENNKFEPLFAKNLFALRGSRWREVRNMLSPAFTSSKMKAMYVLMRDCAKQYGEHFANLPEDQRTVELKDAFTRYTNDVIATCAFGVNVDSMKDRTNKFYVYGRESTSFGRLQSFRFFLIRCMPWLSEKLGVRIVKKQIAEFFQDLVTDTIKTRDEQGIVRPDMLQLMMETRGKLGPGKELTIEDMTAQAFVFFFGGFESTSTLMCFAAYEVGVNEDVQSKLQDEIDQVLEEGNGEVTYEAINNMKYLDGIIHEALRMYPVIVGVDRECVKEFELPPTLPGSKPHVVKEGEYLWIPIYGIHYDPKYFPEPEKFKPERFVEDSKRILNSGTFLTFGLGPRMCIGNRFAIMEAKTLLFHIFARCSLKVCSKTILPMKLSRSGFGMTAENGFWFTIQPRNKNKIQQVNSVSNSSVAC